MLADNDNLYWDPEQTLGQEDDEDPAADEETDKTVGDVSVSNDDDIDDAGKDEDDQDEDDRDQNDDPEIRYNLRPKPSRPSHHDREGQNVGSIDLSMFTAG